MEHILTKASEELKKFSRESFGTHLFVGTDTRGISFKKFAGDSWCEVFNNMLDAQYINFEDVYEYLNGLCSEADYLDAIINYSNAYYYDYKGVDSNG